jgi:acetyl/propionyl-CoA carboxylase alpha subunit
LISSAVALHLASNEHLLTTHTKNHHAHNNVNSHIQENAHELYAEEQRNTTIAVLDGPKGQAFEVQTRISDEFVASIAPLDNQQRPIESQRTEVRIGSLEWEAGQYLAQVHFNLQDKEESSSVQYLKQTAEGLVLRFRGCEQEIILRTPKEHAMQQYMLKPEVKDFSKFLISPMPGTLISCSVQEGQEVQEGQQLAVVEAMKMQVFSRAYLFCI